MAPKHGPLPPRKPSPYNSYLRYSSLALQLLLTIAITGWLGYKLDQYVGNKYPLFMLLFGFLGFGGVMYKIYRSINRPSD